MKMLSKPVKATLYHTQFWSSSKPAYLLKGLGLTGPDGPIAIETITEKQLKEDTTLTALNPQKRLPFFYDPASDLKLNESSGMIEYLLETYDKENKMWPAPGDATRAEYLKLLHFGPATAYHISIPIFGHYMPAEGMEPTSVKRLEEKKKEWHKVVAPTYEQALDKYGGPFLLGEKYTAVDIVAGYDLMTLSFAGCGIEMMEAHPKVKQYFEKIKECPIYKELYTPPSN